ncbi:septal ring lytic transglycosylase RlpA family protein [Ramlibacter sp.]|uniref:septal ring lytic transglycosylase RlpA family protein n=1 Tax=Ramlibacter sp. TaxID=1917967 RepID=UPI002BE779FA|nr:septal ring lytic transglycosylase RlpA family protein [Ramlibacter sp.]HWI82479.1 septal ring lytic transglycosylase RlpA family protein [Ramlibacter sp.]
MAASCETTTDGCAVRRRGLVTLGLAALALLALPPAAVAAGQHAPGTKGRRSRKQVGKASIYSRKFAGRTMADGTRMSPHDDNAASRTLPLGTPARVTNLETGQSTVVTIQDRGPHVSGRIIDLSPRTAREIGLTQRQGVAQVEVTPIGPPRSDRRDRGP